MINLRCTYLVICMPDIGGVWLICISKVDPDVKAKIKSIVVKAFEGIGLLLVMLPDLRLF